MPEQKAQTAVRKTYKAPELLKWGTIADMTLTVGSSGQPDGGKGKTASKTR